MGNSSHRGVHYLRALSQLELASVTQALELDVPRDALLQGVWWDGATPEVRNYRLTLWSEKATPRSSTWLAERAGDVYRLRARPATLDELRALLEALEELGVQGVSSTSMIAEAHYDCRDRTYQLCLTPLEEMVEGRPYKRWLFRRHADGRPLSVGYCCETRRGGGYATLPGAAVLRGNPWPD